MNSDELKGKADQLKGKAEEFAKRAKEAAERAKHAVQEKLGHGKHAGGEADAADEYARKASGEDDPTAEE